MSRLTPSFVFGTAITLLLAFPTAASGPVPADLLSGLV